MINFQAAIFTCFGRKRQKKIVNWIGRNSLQIINLQDTALQVKENKAPAKEDVKFNSGRVFFIAQCVSEFSLMAQCDGNFIDAFSSSWNKVKRETNTQYMYKLLYNEFTISSLNCPTFSQPLTRSHLHAPSSWICLTKQLMMRGYML